MQPARNDMKDLFGDLDKDGIPNMLDCEPHDSTKDGYLGDRWYNFRERVSAIPHQVSKYVPREYTQAIKDVPREIIESKIKRQVSVPLKGREAWKWKPPAISETQEPSALETQESITGKYLLHPLVIKPSIAGIEWYGKRIGEPFRESITESTEKALKTIEQHEKESIKQEPFGRTVVPPGFLPPPISKRLIPITKDVAAGVVEVPPALLGLFGVLGPTVTEMAIREPTVLPGYAAYQAKEMGKYAIEHPVEFTTTMAMMGPVIKGIPKPKYLVGEGYKGLGIKDKPLIGVERGKLKLGEVKIEVARTRPIEAIEYDVIRKVEVDAIKKIQKEMLLTEEGLKISPEIKARSHVKLITETVPERSIPRVERLKYEQEAGRMVLPIEFERFITEPIGKVTQEIGTGLLLLRKERASVGQKIYDQSTLVGESIKTDVKTWVSETSELGKPLKGSEKWVHELIDVDSIKVERPIERGEPVLGKEGVYALEEPRVITETIKGEVESIKGSTKRISDIKTKKGKKQLSLKEIEDVLWEDLLREEKAQLTSGKTISKSFDEITKEIVEDIKIETVKSDIAPMKDVVKTTDKAVSKTKKATTQVHGQPQMTVSRLDEAIQKSVPQRILSKRKIIEDETYYVSERAPMAIRDISMPTIPVQISDVKSMSITMPQVQSVQVPEMKTIQKDIQRELEKTTLVEDIVQIERVTPIQKERILEISKQKPIQKERIRVKPIVPLIKIPKSWEKPPVVAKKKKKDKKVFSFLHDDLEDIYRTRKYAMLTSEEMLKL